MEMENVYLKHHQNKDNTENSLDWQVIKYIWKIVITNIYSAYTKTITAITLQKNLKVNCC